MPALRSVWLPVTVAILLRVGWIAAASRSPLPVDDVDGYLPMAIALAHDQPLVSALRDNVGVLRPPLYPLLLSVPMRLEWPIAWLLVAQTGLAAMAVIAVAGLSGLLAGTRAARIGAWIAACWPPWFAAAGTTATEHLDLPLVAAALALLVAAAQRRDGRRAAASGFCFGAAALVRSASLYLAPALALVAARRIRWRAALTIACLAIVTAPYIAFATRETGRFIAIENLLEWNWAYATGGRAAAESGRARLVDVPGLIAGDYRRHPAENARSAAGRLKMMLASTFSWEPFADRQVPAVIARAVHVASGVGLALLYGFAVFGAVRVPDRTAALLLVAWTLLHVAAAMIGPGIEARHRAPFEPALMALAAGASVILAGCRSRISGSIRISSAV